MQCDAQEGCTTAPNYQYAWPWGKTGYCCLAHRQLVEQLAENLGRKGEVAWIMIAPNMPEPMTQPERIQLNARALAAEQDAADIKVRGMQLLQQNATLQSECQRLQARVNWLDPQVKELQSKLDAMTADRDRNFSDLADARIELERLKAFIPADAGGGLAAGVPAAPQG